jgi:hypothetical protein
VEAVSPETALLSCQKHSKVKNFRINKDEDKGLTMLLLHLGYQKIICGTQMDATVFSQAAAFLFQFALQFFAGLN